MLQLINKVIGDPNTRKIKKLEPVVDMINHFESELEKLTDDQLRAKTTWFQNELANRPKDPDPGRDSKLEAEVLEMILPEAFAVVREASKRTIGLRHYDVQLIGGMILHNGGIAEMRTGEGKTLVATLPAYLNALTGKGVHVVTVNDYLAKRDAEWMGQIYSFLGLTVGTVFSEQRGPESFIAKKNAYTADITYGTNNEFGFDYLRDNMAGSKAQMVQRPYNYAIVDEVDSILIDEARTPLIISGRLEQSADTYRTMARIAPTLIVEEDYTVDEKARNVILSEEGIDHAQELLGVDDLFDPKTNLAHHLLQALKAKELFKRDTDYVVTEKGEVVIVDEFTGRLMAGRRWSDGLHQAVEAKEGVHIQDETQTLASITFQNLFRLYPKLSGMTGTAMTEEAEFGKIYNLTVTAIPTNSPDVRIDEPDIIYKNEKVKLYKVVEDIVTIHETGQPILVGTASIEKSEWLSSVMSKPMELTQHLHEKMDRLKKHIEKNEDLKTHLAPILKSPEAQKPELFDALADDKKTPAEYVEFVAGLGKTVKAIVAIRKGLKHDVLNAKQHAKEAAIVAQAGRYGAITIATNMAGRGTDILLGGNPESLVKEENPNWRELPPEELNRLIAAQKEITDAEKLKVQELGGLYILGTERHESRRIDNQLRGRAARQGDPGSTKFYLSLEDSLMRIFGGAKVSSLMDFMNVDETMPISAGMVSRVIENAQRKVEAYHFDIRKNILKYDDVLTEQRKLIYAQRRKVLEGIGLRDSIVHMIEQEMARVVSAHITVDADPQDWDEIAVVDMLATLRSKVPQLTHVDHDLIKGKNYPELITLFQQQAFGVYEGLEAELVNVAGKLNTDHGIDLLGVDADLLPQEKETLFATMTDAEKAVYCHPLRRIERDILLSIVDAKWIDYLHNLDALREGIGLRAYGQKDPLLEYKREAFELFQNMTYDIQQETVMLLFRSKIQIQLEHSFTDELARDASNQTAEV